MVGKPFKYFLCSFFVTFTVAISLCTVCLVLRPGARDKQESYTPKRILYVHGWLPLPDMTCDEDLRIIQSIFPNDHVELIDWGGRTADFNLALEQSEHYVLNFADRFSLMSDKERENTVLLGHSLGARIIIKTMALLRKQNKSIRYGVFLAAAIPHDDNCIHEAIQNSIEPSINIYYYNDYVLKHLYSVSDSSKNALGTYGYAFPFNQHQMIQIEMELDSTPVSSVADYIEDLKKHGIIHYLDCLKEKTPFIEHIKASSLDSIDNSTSIESINKINVIQDNLNFPVKIIDIGWDTVDSFEHWRLQRKSPSEGALYRILDPLDFQKANGSKTKMEYSFQQIKEQLIQDRAIKD